MGFANEILDAIEIMVRQVVEDNTTKIYTGVCKTVSTSTCSLLINGKENTVKYYGGTPIVGTVYQVFIPFGNMSAAFIIVPGAGGQDPETGVSSVNGKTGAVVLTASDVGALPNTTTIPTKTSQLDNDSGFIDSSALDEYAKTADIPTKTSQLTNNSGFITVNDVPEYSVIKSTDTTDYAAVYYLTKNGVNTGVAINIPKDLFVESGEIVTNPSGQPVGKYLKLVLQNQAEPIYINVADLVDAYTSGIGISISTNNEISIKIVVGNGLSADTDGIKMATVTTTTNGAMLSGDKAKLDGIENGAQKNTVTGIKGDNEATYRVGNVNITKANIGLNNVDNVKQYSLSNPPPYPVSSVNNKTGAVSLDASDVGAVSTSDITQTLGTSTTKVPSEKAVSDALSGAGAGDMLKAIYDPNDSVATAGGIPNYVEANGGKIDTIKVNGATQPIANKEVDITVPTNNNQLTNGAGYITASEAPVTSVNGQTGDVTVSAELPEHLVKYDTLAPIETTTLVNADTLQGHAASYFATGTEVSALSAVVDSNTDDITVNTQNISTNTQNISTLQSNISALQSSVNGKVSKSGDTMTGALVAQNNTNYSVAQMRNIIISTSNPSGGNSGDIWIKYTK